MPGFHVHTGNRTEVLVARLAAVLRDPLAHPLTPEIIVLQSRGMERWVAMELAQAPAFDAVVVNDRLKQAVADVDRIVRNALEGAAQRV